MTRVVVIGGGISGLAAARELAVAGVEVTVLEASGRWGGKLRSTEIDGLRLDTGAESVLARRPEAVGLMADLGAAADRVHPTGAKPALLVEGELRALPPSVLGVPTDLDRLRPLLSAAGYAAALRSSGVDAPLAQDLPIGTAVDERFGPEVTDRLLEPLLGGVYAGQSRQLSFEAVAPELFALARHGGSLLEHARAMVRPSDTPVFAGLSGGVATLVDALLADLAQRGVRLRNHATVRELDRLPDGRFALQVQQGDRPDVVSADAVVSTAPARATGRLLAGLVPIGADFSQLAYASVAVLTLVVHGLDTATSGVLVPPRELPTIKAMTHSSIKWRWVAERAESTWGPGVSVVRVSIGRLGEEALLQLPDRDLVRRTWVEAAGLPGWAGASLVASVVTRWGGALPQYHVGHRALVSTLRAQVSDVPGLAVAGAALDGVGVAACLGSVRRGVTKIMTDLGAERGSMDGLEPAKGSRT